MLKFSRAFALWGGPLLAGIIWIGLQAALGHAIAFTLGVAFWCVLWWVLEPIPIPITSLLPLALFPLAGVLSPAQVGQAFGSPLILLLLGGFILSMAMERSGAHRRLALNMVKLFGARRGWGLLAGFVCASAMLSMWISNTATTLMLLPVVLAVVQASDDQRLQVPLLLGIAYAASIGGMGTPIGTPPNLVFMQVYHDSTGMSVGFLEWMSWAVPVVLLLLPITVVWLGRHMPKHLDIDLPEVGQWQAHEKRVLLVFAATALAWVTRREPFGGWSAWLELPQANDASVALVAVVLMFMLPNGKGERLLAWSDAVRIPWGVLLLFGGGICLAKAFVASGLSEWLGQYLQGVAGFSLLLMTFLIALGVSFLTETTSNTASTTLLMPILAAAALSASIDPKFIMVPAVMSASCAFMLPVATAPNSIIFGSGKISGSQMVREGFVLNLVAVLIISLVCIVRL